MITICSRGRQISGALLPNFVQGLSCANTLFIVAMNSFLANGQQYLLNLAASGRFIPQPQINTNPYFQHIVQQQQQQQQQNFDLNKVLQLRIQCQQFVQNFFFTNSSRYHSICLPQSRLASSTNDQSKDIAQDIVKQFKSSTPNLVLSDSDITDSESTDSVYKKNEEMNRGQKRPFNSSPLQTYPMQQKRARSEDRQSSHATYGILTDNQYEQMSRYINDHYDDKRQHQALFESKMKLRAALYAIMKGVFPYCGLYVVGSSMNGFGGSSSDMDMCLMLSHSQLDQKREATEILRILLRALCKCSFLSKVILINAKVPILKFYDHISQVECDLNINNSVGIRNTHLLNAYCKTDWRLAPLVLFVKHWAKCHNINEAKDGTVSSYSLGLMVIHFLQCGVSPPVLPCLQEQYPHMFDMSTDIRLLNLNDDLPEYQSTNKQSVGELFLGFLHYYTQVFSFTDTAMSIRLGSSIPRHTAMQNGPQPQAQWKCLCIEEPFDRSNTARSVYDEYTFTRVLRVFRQSYVRLRNTGHILSVLQAPF